MKNPLRARFRVLPGEPILISRLFRESFTYPLPIRRNRNCQPVKKLPIFRGQLPALLGAVPNYKIEFSSASARI